MTNVIVGSYFGGDAISVIGGGSSVVTVGLSHLPRADSHSRLAEEPPSIEARMPGDGRPATPAATSL